MHIDHASALRVADLAERDGDLVRLAQELWDKWAEIADGLGLCLDCEAPSPTAAYCRACDQSGGVASPTDSTIG